MNEAYIHEIFASIQGEGPWIGQRHIFVRFQGCDIGCRYCDTPLALPLVKADVALPDGHVHLGTGPGTKDERIPNPVSGEALSQLCSRFVLPGPARPVLSLTGGEPLLQHEFLRTWLPRVREHYRVYLETSGIHDRFMRPVADLIDVVSMDFKLPSATGLRPFWEEHERFLAATSSTDLFVKAVVTRDTTTEEVLEAARLIARFNAAVPLILQPAGGAFAPSSAMLIEFQDAALEIIEDVRVIPQAHKILQIP